MPSSGSTTQRRPRRPLVVAALLAEEAVARPRRRQALADQPLGGVVGLRDEVGRARLGGHVHARPGERLAQLAAGLARDRLGDLAQPARRSCRQRRPPLGPARARPRAARRATSSSGSPSRGATSWADAGSRRPSKPRAPRPRAGRCGCRRRSTARSATEPLNVHAPGGPSYSPTRGGRRVNIGVSTASTPSRRRGRAPARRRRRPPLGALERRVAGSPQPIRR